MGGSSENDGVIGGGVPRHERLVGSIPPGPLSWNAGNKGVAKEHTWKENGEHKERKGQHEPSLTPWRRSMR
jgi:hypothetical protein